MVKKVCEDAMKEVLYISTSEVIGLQQVMLSFLSLVLNHGSVSVLVTVYLSIPALVSSKTCKPMVCSLSFQDICPEIFSYIRFT